MKNKSPVNLNHSRGENQRKNMEESLKVGVCLFCPKHIKKYHSSPIEKNGKFWMVTKNDYPYEGTKHHYLFIYRKHIDSLAKITTEGMKEFLVHLKWLEKKFKIQGGSILMRFGDSNRTSATITHLHAHLIVGGKGPNRDRISTFVGYKK